MTMTSKSIEKSTNELEIKAEKDGDIRRFECDGSVTSLLSKLRGMYKLGTDFQIKFKDDEGELVTIANDKDLATAVRICGSKLRIVVRAPETRPDTFADVHLALGELSSGDEDEDIEEDEEEPSVQPEPDIEALNPDMPSVDAIHAHRGGWHRGRGRGRGHRGHHDHHDHHDHHRDRRHHGHQHGHHEHHEHHERKHHDHLDVNERHKGRGRGGRGRGGRSRICADKDKEEPYFPRQRKLLARIVKHVTLPDGAKADPGAALKKTWRLRNDSQVAWPEHCEIICVGGDMILGNTMPAGAVRVRGGVLAGQETDVSVDLVAPAEPGLYQASFRLKEVDGRKFGQRIWLSINVTAGTSESDEFVEVPAHGRDDGTLTSPNESNDYEMAIEKLREMGFTDGSVPRLVHRYRGNVERVAHRLIRKAK